MDDLWIVAENIRRYRGQFAEAKDESRRSTLKFLLEREEKLLLKLTSEPSLQSPTPAAPAAEVALDRRA
jgi:hypothetical protein